jgi:hypothetical protein
MNQSGTAQYVANLAHHTYDFPSDSARDPTITGALAMNSIIHRDLTLAGDSAFHWWTAVSKVMGCSPRAATRPAPPASTPAATTTASSTTTPTSPPTATRTST